MNGLVGLTGGVSEYLRVHLGGHLATLRVRTREGGEVCLEGAVGVLRDLVARSGMVAGVVGRSRARLARGLGLTVTVVGMCVVGISFLTLALRDLRVDRLAQPCRARWLQYRPNWEEEIVAGTEIPRRADRRPRRLRVFDIPTGGTVCVSLLAHLRLRIAFRERTREVARTLCLCARGWQQTRRVDDQTMESFMACTVMFALRLSKGERHSLALAERTGVEEAVRAFSGGVDTGQRRGTLWQAVVGSRGFKGADILPLRWLLGQRIPG